MFFQTRQPMLLVLQSVLTLFILCSQVFTYKCNREDVNDAISLSCSGHFVYHSVLPLGRNSSTKDINKTHAVLSSLLMTKLQHDGSYGITIYPNLALKVSQEGKEQLALHLNHGNCEYSTNWTAKVCHAQLS